MFAALVTAALAVGLAVTTSGCKKGSSGPASDAGPRDGTSDAKDATAVDCTTLATAARPNSSSCLCDKQCASGICADGVCCDAKCDKKCMACNLPTSLGQCTNVPAGGTPTSAAECLKSDPSTCGQDGTCDGNGGCRPWVKGSECQHGTCNGDGVSANQVCDGKGSCGPGQAEACSPYSCDPATNKCQSTCTSTCAVGHLCVNGSCGKKAGGAVCVADDECASSHCTDGVCCNVACSGPCQSCNQTGSVGRCLLTAPGLSDPGCAAEMTTTCGLTGLCDKAGACSHFPANTTVCSEAVCVGDSMLSSARSCDGLGTCGDAQFLDCAPYKCSSGACKVSCDSDADCTTGHPCVAVPGGGAKQCSGLKQDGLVCMAGTECASGNCVDGVCCETTCEGACRSCALQGSLGRCTNVAKGGKDVRAMCLDKGQASCGTDGLCDGTGACETYAAGSTCGDETCNEGSYTPAATCNNQGQCVSPSARTCNPFTCQGSKCLSRCTKDGDCTTGNVCVNGSCGLKPFGAECTVDADCQSSHCAQGVCCNSACNTACVSCDLQGSMGVCTTVKDGTIDPQTMCAITVQNTCSTTGRCQGGACAKWSAGARCIEASCSSASAAKPASTCNGTGMCVTPADRSCGNFKCAGDACLTSCTTDGDCIAPTTCVVATGSCGLKANGAPCTGATQCSSGICTEGVCCDTACSDGAGTSGLCRSCKVSGKVGTCSAVGSGDPDPKNRCVATSPSSGNCANDGTCNGAGACRPWSSSTGCRMQSCTGSTLTMAANCNGTGTCTASATSGCDPYVCNSSSPSCLTTCTSNTDCVAGLTCRKIDNRCGDKLPNGQPCGANADCSSNACTQGVCCDGACGGGCESCLVAANVGKCSPIAAGGTPRVATMCTASPPCGNTGLCNGSRGCAQGPTTTPCNVTMTCTGAAMTGPASTCNGAGQCAAPTPVPCGTGYVCVGSACATSCSGNPSAACATGFACIGGQCKPPVGLGTACTADTDCASGACVSNGTTKICCASACADQACGTKALCAANGSACQTHMGEMCAAATCSADSKSSIGASSCNGSGLCAAPTPVPCMTGYLCSAGVCATSCSATAPCASGFTCIGGECKVPLAVGQSCTAASDCAMGNCVSTAAGAGAAKVCCATACADQACGSKALCLADGTACQTHAGDMCTLLPSCSDSTHKVDTGTCNGLGTCTPSAPVSCPGATCSSGSVVPASTCSGAGVCSMPTPVPCAASCSADGLSRIPAGTCNAGACSMPTAVLCGAATCSTDGFSRIPASTCSGAGMCSTPAEVSCMGYLCAAGACTGSCTIDTDCATGYTCDTSMGPGVCMSMTPGAGVTKPNSNRNGGQRGK